MQLKAWEEYTSKLEEKYVALMTEHEAFQRELAAVRGILDDGTDAQIHGTHHSGAAYHLIASSGCYCAGEKHTCTGILKLLQWSKYARNLL